MAAFLNFDINSFAVPIWVYLLVAVVGLVASGSKPLVLIYVPLGIVLCGAATGIAKALSQGLHYRILKLLGLPEDEARKASLSDTSRAATAS